MAFLRSRFAKAGQDHAVTTSSSSGAGSIPAAPLSRDSSPISLASSSSYASDPDRKLCIAIIGSGLTGLSASYFVLCPDENEPVGSRPGRPIEVHLFERADKIGLDSNSITINQTGLDGTHSARPEVIRVDVPMRSLNAGYYPSVMALYRRLGISLKKSNFTYSFATFHTSSPPTGPSNTLPSHSSLASPRHQAPPPSILYEGSSGMRGFGIPHTLRTIPRIRTTSPGSRSASLKRSDLVASRWYTLPFYFISLFSNALGIVSYLSSIVHFLLNYLYLVSLAFWHHYSGNTRDPNHPLASTTLQTQFASTDKENSSVFLKEVVVPLFSAMMTVQASSVLLTPIAEVLDYVALTFGRSHYTVTSGVHEVESVIAAPMAKENIHVGCEVTGLTRHRGRVDVEVIEGGEEAVYEGFDHVILATQAHQSAAFVASYLESLDTDSSVPAETQERKRLQQMLHQLRHFTSENSEVVNHTDRSLLPREESDWRDLNLVTPVRPSTASDQSLEKGSDVSVEEASSAAVSQAVPSGTSPSTLASNTHTMASHILHQDPTPSAASSTWSPEAASRVLIQTTNPLLDLRPAEDKILSSSHFERAKLTLQSKAGQAGLFEWRRRERARGQALRVSISSAVVSLPSSAIDLLSRSWTEGLFTTLERTVRSCLPVSRWELCLGDLQGRGEGESGRGEETPFNEIQGQLEQGGTENGGPVEATSSAGPGPGIWVCGSWSPGIPLLEGCVVSSKLVVDALLKDEARRAQMRAQGS